NLGCDVHAIARGKTEPRLASSDQFEINARRELCIEERPMFDTAGEVNTESSAKFVKGIPGAGDFRFRNLDRVDRAGGHDQRPSDAKELRIDEFQVKAGVVHDKR